MLTVVLKDKKETEMKKELTDAQVEHLLDTHIAGGSKARDWFWPGEKPTAAHNLREVVRRMVAAHEALQVDAINASTKTDEIQGKNLQMPTYDPNIRWANHTVEITY